MSPSGLNPIAITDPGDERVAEYMNLKDAHLAVLAGDEPADRAAGLFIAEGSLVVRQAIASSYRVRSVLGLPGRLDAMADVLGGLPAGTPVYAAERDVVERIVGFDLHRGILASCYRGPPRSVEDLASSCNTLVVLEDLANHDNVGGIFRCVAALAGPRAGVVLSPRCCDPLYRKAIRVSTGHALRVPFARASDWPGDLDRLRDAGFAILALDAGTDATGLDRAHPGPKTALVVGAEGPGLGESSLSMADVRLRIPMAPGVDSLNAMVACAIALHRLATPAG